MWLVPLPERARKEKGRRQKKEEKEIQQGNKPTINYMRPELLSTIRHHFFPSWSFSPSLPAADPLLLIPNHRKHKMEKATPRQTLRPSSPPSLPPSLPTSHTYNAYAATPHPTQLYFTPPPLPPPLPPRPGGSATCSSLRGGKVSVFGGGVVNVCQCEVICLVCFFIK